MSQHSSQRVVLVTGAAHRIGRAIALAFAKRGWDVAVHYQNSAKAADETVAAIGALGRRAVALGADLGDEAQTIDLMARAVAALGDVHCVVNNASRFEYDDALAFNYQRLQQQVSANLAAPVMLARELFLRTPLEATGDEARVVINLLDQKLFNPNPDFLSYTLSKAGLQAATVLLAQALAPRVRVVGVAPGITLPAPGQSQVEFEAAHRKTPLGEASRMEDIAQAVCFLAQARAVTGTTLIVDGGQHLIPSVRDVIFTGEPGQGATT